MRDKAVPCPNNGKCGYGSHYSNSDQYNTCLLQRQNRKTTGKKVEAGLRRHPNFLRRDSLRNKMNSHDRLNDVTFPESTQVNRRAELGAKISIGAYGVINAKSIGNNVKIGHHVSIEEGAIIGDNIVIGDNTVIGKDVTIEGINAIGKGSVVHDNSLIGQGTILSHGVMVGYQTTIQDSVIKDNSRIGGGSHIKGAIVQPGVEMGLSVSVVGRASPTDGDRLTIGAFTQISENLTISDSQPANSSL